MTSLVTIRLRRREASELRDVLSIRTTAGLARVQAALDAALKPRQANGARAEKFARRATKRGETARIRKAVFWRAASLRLGEQCEGPWARPPNAGNARCSQRAEDLHHVFGRVRAPQSERNTVALCRKCHRDVTDNEPDAAFWWAWWTKVLGAYGFTAEASQAEALLRKHEAKAQLGEMRHGG